PLLPLRSFPTRRSSDLTPKPLLACVMAVTAKQTKFLKQVPGVVLSQELEQHLAYEIQANPIQAKKRSVQRLALHIVGLKIMGFAGVHLSGVHNRQALRSEERRVGKEWRSRWCRTP